MPISIKSIKILTNSLTGETKEDSYTKDEESKLEKMRRALGNIDKRL